MQRSKFLVLSTTILFITTLIMAVPLSGMAAPPPELGQDYIVQADDWLSKLADKFYNDPQAYPLIIEATNILAQQDASYLRIDNPDMLEVGQKLFIPHDQEVINQLQPAPSAVAVESSDEIQETVVPQSPTPKQAELLASLTDLGKPPELYNEVWLNSDPLKLADLQGQVVIVEFWTYG